MKPYTPASGGSATYLTALVVEPTLADSLFVIGALTSGGYRVTVADFQEAKARLAFSPPHLLVIDVRQGNFNGLHLVLRGKSVRPRMAALVTSRHPDIVLQRDTESAGGTFVIKPTTRVELLAAAARTLWRTDASATAEPIRAPFERRIAERRQLAQPIGSADRRRVERRRAASLAIT